MSDYSGIGDAMVMLAALAAFGVPAAICGLIGLAFAAFGFAAFGLIIGVAGSIVGVIFAAYVVTQA